MGGYVIMHNNGCVDWASKSVKIVPDSTCEAETAVASFASKATCFLRMLFTFHKIPVTAATPMLGDCKASYDLITQWRVGSYPLLRARNSSNQARSTYVNSLTVPHLD